MAAIAGKTMAALFLERRGYEVLATPWTCEANTVGVVARAPEGEIVFAEAALSEDLAAGFPERGSTTKRAQGRRPCRRRGS